MAQHPFFAENSTATRPRPLLANVFILMGLVLVGLFAGQLLGMLLAQVFTGIPITQLPGVLVQPARYPGAWAALMWLQSGSSLGGFVLAPWLFLRFFDAKTELNFGNSTPAAVWLLVPVLVVLAMPFNGWVYELNQALDLPPALQGLEDWMKQKETDLDGLTKFLTNFDSPLRLLVGLLVIAVIPALGEELLFRGVLQNLFRRAFGNVHVAIWLSAAVFSAIHFQFYGFLPRLLLGALFGYLYAWTRHLGVAMLAHFVNNGFTLLMVYLFRQKLLDYDIENTEAVPISAAALSFGLTALLLYAVYQRRKTSAGA